MKLNKITIENIRSHSYLEFEPESVGLTAIVGENGAGKSTILDSFAWALFGTKPPGLKNSDFIREGIDPKTEKVQISAEFSLADSEYKVTRRIMAKTGSSYCHVYSKNSSDNVWVLECGPGVSHSESFIRKLLGYDEKGFLAASYIQQKQVDQIISSGPKERSQVIEKLIGVSSITEAIKQAKDESKALQKAASVIQVGSIEEEEEKYKQQIEQVENASKKFTEYSSQLQVMELEFQKIASDYNEELEKQTTFDKLTTEITIIENNLESLASRQADQLDIIEKTGQTKISETKVEKVKKEGSESVIQKKQLEEELISLKAELASYESLFSISIKEDIEEKLSQNKSKTLNVDRKILSAQTEIAEIKSKAKFSRDYLSELSRDKASCPMCGSEICDKETEKVKVETTISECKTLFAKKNEEINILTAERDKLINEALTLNKLVETKRNQDNSKEKFANIKQRIYKLEAEHKTVSIKLEKLTKEMTAIKEAQNNISLVTSAKATIKMLSETSREQNKKKRELEKNLKTLNAKTKKEFRKQEDYKKKLEEKIHKLNLLKMTSDKDVIVEKSKLREIEINLENCKRAQEEYTKLASRIETLNMSIKSMSEFKELRVHTSIPELTKLASDLLNSFTNGEFIEMKLSDSFDSSVVTSSGQKRPVAQLSGGELSAAAIALRLAISIFLSNNSQSLLILDEVLVSMSEERSQLILETISSLPQSQVIMVAHSAILNSFADKVVNI